MGEKQTPDNVGIQQTKSINMKKILLLFALILAVINFTACSNDAYCIANEQTQKTDHTETGIEELSQEIYGYNTSLFKETRGLKLSFKKLWRSIVVITADALGGTVGAIAGGGPVGALTCAGIASGTAGGLIDGTHCLHFDAPYASY